MFWPPTILWCLKYDCLKHMGQEKCLILRYLPVLLIVMASELYEIVILGGSQLLLALIDKTIHQSKISACLRALPLSLKTFLVSTGIMVSSQELLSQIGSE